jgi:Fe-S-cluster containining protein
MNTLIQLHTDIETRVQSIRQQCDNWLCRAGCDSCCHRLADIPQLTIEEWNYLQIGLNLLPTEQLQEISHKIMALTEQTTRPLVCPFLDLSAGICLVYFYRPIACRTYGFYVERDIGLYCQEIKAQVDTGMLDDIVWGNQEVIDNHLNQLGEKRDLTEWFIRWQEIQNNITQL